ncbi:hypothetical protein HDU85_002855 [Gaertneriomyces sp. JEL0708]|nr:hypothetical protein HDU85_002855 [Gaertneriomyces sp. JEL0708]
MDITFQNISYQIPRKRPKGQRARTAHSPDPESLADGKNRKILDNISGSWRKGQLVGIFGVSGSGKSTLLECLAGRKRGSSVTGRVWIDQQPREKYDMRQLSGYVDQDDCFLNNLTVRETLLYSLQLRVSDKDMPIEKKHRRVQRILEVLHLQKAADSRIGDPMKRGISGGERRRVTIGLELITLPPLLFCDEITSGLSAKDALRVMRIVRKLCATGRHTVVCTIHQPRSSIFYMFDQILLLHEGRTVYCGAGGADALDYFNRLGMPCPMYSNPADWLLDLMVDEDEYAPDPELDNTSPEPPVVPRGQSLEEGLSVAPSAQRTTLSLHGGVLASSISGPDLAAPPIGHARELSSASIDLFRGLQGVKQQHRYSAADLSNLFTKSRDYVALQGAIYALAQSEGQTGIQKKWASQRTPVSYSRECYLLTKRQFVDSRRSPILLYARTIVTVLVALIAGAVFMPRVRHNDEDPYLSDQESANQKVNSLLFLMCVFSLFALPAVGKMVDCRILFHRERQAGYVHPLPYIISLTLVELPILLMTIIVYGCISYWMVGLVATAGHFAFFLLTITLVILCSFCIAQAVAAGAGSNALGMALFCGVFVWSLLLGGFLVRRPLLPNGIQWIVYTSYLYFGFEALVINEFSGQGSIGAEFLNFRGFSPDDQWLSIAKLAAWVVFWRIVGYFILRYLQHARKQNVK